MKWISVKESTPNTPKEVLCVDAIGNYFIGRYYTRDGWMVSMYDEPDKSNEYNPDVTHWCEIETRDRRSMTIDEYKKQFIALYTQLAEEHGACSGVYIAPDEELCGVSRVSIEIRF